MKKIKNKEKELEDTSFLIGPLKQIITMKGLPKDGELKDSSLQNLPNGGILIEKGEIVEVGNFKTLKNLYSPKTIKHLTKDYVALPGFIDAHTHICYAGSRFKDYALRLSGLSYQEIAKKKGGILETVTSTREATKETLINGILDRSQKLLQNGVTTCEVKSGYGLSIESEMKMLQAIQEATKNSFIDLIPTCLAAHTRPLEYSCSKKYLKDLELNLLKKIKDKNLANRVDIFIEEGAFSVEESREFLKKAKKMGFSICMHIDQFSRGGAQLAAELGVLSADHLEQSIEKDFIQLKQAGVIPIALPGASLGLGQPFCLAKKMLKAGLPLVIASDWNPGSAPMGDLLTQAALLGASEKLTIAETLAAITTRAAKALELFDRGEIRKGLRADFSLFPCCDYREILYHQGSLKPHYVFSKGKGYELRRELSPF